MRYPLQTPFGPFIATLSEDGRQLLDLCWAAAPCLPGQSPTALINRLEEALSLFWQTGDESALATLRTQLLMPAGHSAFRQAVWAQVNTIPVGQTRTYGQLARALSKPAQAVGQALKANPFPLITPCHRVVAAPNTKNLKGGYAGLANCPRKAALLAWEAGFTRAVA